MEKKDFPKGTKPREIFVYTCERIAEPLIPLGYKYRKSKNDIYKKDGIFRCVQLRKHSKAREKRYSFGYAVSFIFACYQILWTFPKSQYLCSRYLPLVCG